MNHSIIVIIIIIGIGMSFRVNQLIFTVVDRCDQSQVRGVIDTARLNARIEDENESSSDEEMLHFTDMIKSNAKTRVAAAKMNTKPLKKPIDAR